MKPLSSAKFATGVCCYLSLIAGCASQPDPIPEPPKAVEVQQPSPQDLLQQQLQSAFDTLQANQLAEAHAAYSQALKQAVPGSRGYHEACAGLIVSLSKNGDNPVRNLNRALEILDILNASMARATRDLDSSERVTFITLRQMLEGELREEKLQESLNEETRKQQQLVRENQQLQEALFKLRRLSLE